LQLGYQPSQEFDYQFQFLLELIQSHDQDHQSGGQTLWKQNFVSACF